MNPVAVVGAGFAGLSAAVALADAGIPVDVFEASHVLGGRARTVEVEGLPLDNGAHILIGAYRETLRLMRHIGAPGDALTRMPLRIDFPGRFRLEAPRLPAPLHLACALLTTRGLSLSDKLAAARFIHYLKSLRFQLPTDIPVTALLARQPERVCRWLWHPLCLAALNTLPEEASAQVFVNVLRDSLAANRTDCDLMLPARDLSSLFADPAAEYVAAHGGNLHRRTRIRRINRVDGVYHLDGHGSFRAVILAVAPYHLPPLIAGFPELADLTARIATLRWEPIVTCYLGFPAEVRLPSPMIGVADGLAQWLFDRGALCGQHGLVAAVISARGRHTALAHNALADRIRQEVGQVVADLPQPLWHKVIAERRATFACTPGLARPTTAAALSGLWLAGDYVAGDYPATIEGAVISGLAAARSIIQQSAAGKP